MQVELIKLSAKILYYFVNSTTVITEILIKENRRMSVCDAMRQFFNKESEEIYVLGFSTVS